MNTPTASKFVFLASKDGKRQRVEVAASSVESARSKLLNAGFSIVSSEPPAHNEIDDSSIETPRADDEQSDATSEGDLLEELSKARTPAAPSRFDDVQTNGAPTPAAPGLDYRTPGTVNVPQVQYSSRPFVKNYTSVNVIAAIISAFGWISILVGVLSLLGFVVSLLDGNQVAAASLLPVALGGILAGALQVGIGTFISMARDVARHLLSK